MDGKWRLEGHDRFANEWYPLEGEHDDEAAAQVAAGKRLEELERTQPTETSGGQSDNGIQDTVYILRPNGSKYRFKP